MATKWLSFPKVIGEERECFFEPGALPATTQRSACKVYSAGSYRSLRREATCWRELRFSFLRMLVTWWCTVCSESASSEAILRLLSPRVTRTATSCSRRVRGSGTARGEVSSALRAYSMACSGDIARPSDHATAQVFSSSEERAVARSLS